MVCYQVNKKGFEVCFKLPERIERKGLCITKSNNLRQDTSIRSSLVSILKAIVPSSMFITQTSCVQNVISPRRRLYCSPLSTRSHPPQHPDLPNSSPPGAPAALEYPHWRQGAGIRMRARGLHHCSCLCCGRPGKSGGRWSSGIELWSILSLFRPCYYYLPQYWQLL